MSHEGCRNLLASLSEYLDGSLEEALCREIEQHMAGCENCRVVIDTLQKTIYLYHTTSRQVTVPTGVRERLFHRLDLDEFLKAPRD